jgi:hypothetical protein
MSVRRLQDFDNTNFGTLDSSRDKDVVFFNNSTGNFELRTIEQTLVSSTSSATPSTFVQQIEREVDISNIEFKGIDGGEF